MEITEKKENNAMIFVLKGRLDSSASEEVEKKILQSIEMGTKNVILDFSALSYISSAGIRLLVHCHKKIEKQNRRILLVALPKAIENVLYITGFLSYFKVYDHQDQAITALKGHL
ncbi:MAG: STAS domain-containing protein [Chlamydiales bacterium]